MEPICSDHEIELSRAASFKLDLNFIRRLIDAFDAIAKNGFDLAVNFGEDGRGEIAARDADEMAVSHAFEYAGGKPGYAFPALVDYSYLADDISFLFDFLQDAHAAGDLEPGAPEVDDVTAGAQAGRSLDDSRRESVL